MRKLLPWNSRGISAIRMRISYTRQFPYKPVNMVYGTHSEFLDANGRFVSVLYIRLEGSDTYYTVSIVAR